VGKIVLDASALLAFLQLESGGKEVAERLAHAHISAINLAEVIAKLLDKGHTLENARRIVDNLALSVETVDETQAYISSAFRAPTRKSGLSLGDRFCLALAVKLGTPVVTTDKSWEKLGLGIEVVLAR
jgi:PIN domain nuclease of toxin-antitoxin system